MQNVGVVQYLYKEFAETQCIQKDQKHNNLGLTLARLRILAYVYTDNKDIPIVQNVMKMTNSQIVIPDTSPDKQQPVSNVKY